MIQRGYGCAHQANDKSVDVKAQIVHRIEEDAQKNRNYGESHSQRIRMLIVEHRDEHHAGNGHDLETLIGSDGVVLQRVVGEHHKAAEGERHGQHFHKWYVYALEHAQAIAYEQTEECDYEMNAGERHVGKSELDVNVFV